MGIIRSGSQSILYRGHLISSSGVAECGTKYEGISRSVGAVAQRKNQELFNAMKSTEEERRRGIDKHEVWPCGRDREGEMMLCVRMNRGGVIGSENQTSGSKLDSRTAAPLQCWGGRGAAACSG